MPLRYAFLAVAALCVAGLAEAQAQSPFPPVGQQQASPFPPVGQEEASPFPSPNTTTVFGVPGQQQPAQAQPQAQAQSREMPPCIKDFISLREGMEKQFDIVKNTMAKKPTAAEACGVLTRFTQSEATLIKFVEKNSSNCPFPPGLLDTIKASNAKSDGFKKQACTAAAQQQQQRVARPTQPTLSDAFAAPAPSAANTRKGGTYDTLSGNPLAR